MLTGAQRTKRLGVGRGKLNTMIGYDCHEIVDGHGVLTSYHHVLEALPILFGNLRHHASNEIASDLVEALFPPAL